jgi:hypothetical protein
MYSSEDGNYPEPISLLSKPTTEAHLQWTFCFRSITGRSHIPASLHPPLHIQYSNRPPLYLPDITSLKFCFVFLLLVGIIIVYMYGIERGVLIHTYICIV